MIGPMFLFFKLGLGYATARKRFASSARPYDRPSRRTAADRRASGGGGGDGSGSSSERTWAMGGWISACFSCFSCFSCCGCRLSGRGWCGRIGCVPGGANNGPVLYFLAVFAVSAWASLAIGWTESFQVRENGEHPSLLSLVVHFKKCQCEAISADDQCRCSFAFVL